MERLRRMFGRESDCLGHFVSLGHRRFPNHFEHGRFGINLPSVRRDARPAVAIEVFGGSAKGDEAFEAWPLLISETKDGRKTRSIPARLSGPVRVAGVRAGKRMPGNVIEQVFHS